MYPQPDIVTCAQWKARPASGRIKQSGKPIRTVLHHTAGVGGRDKKAYARTIQNFHMDTNGWVDSGHNFLVCVDGTILEGRHGSVSAIFSGLMVVSAHCPGQNGQPGVEHEEKDGPMTALQFEASVRLHAWISDRCHVPINDLYRPHREFYATACPGDLYGQIPALRAAVNAALKPKPTRVPEWWWPWAEWRLGRGLYKGHANDPVWRPVNAPETIPGWAWDKLKVFST